MSKPVLGLLAGLALVSAAPLVLSPKGSRNTPDVAALQDLLAHLRALRQVYHTTHWNVSGGNYYGDHLLFQRLYAGEGSGPTLDDQIDGLGERMVRYFGGHTVSDSIILPRMEQVASRAESESDPIRRAFQLEQDTHRAIESAYEALKATGHKTLGLDDFLMALADERDTVLYLLGQRLDERPTFAAPQKQQRRQQQRRQQGSGNAGCGCGSKNCAGYCGSKNCSCGTR